MNRIREKIIRSSWYMQKYTDGIKQSCMLKIPEKGNFLSLIKYIYKDSRATTLIIKYDKTYLWNWDVGDKIKMPAITIQWYSTPS